ncbi:MFS general substrate transporter [Aspergillus sclerotioniger CBS 115572]|uniref:MFS general substrate transporter n=1 Tax=Aspergillus sclerotioniger CBS 115572 TaxID=1450535 RepID=A0A317X7Z5_9EURO|nr:MFS general substrate transporter [Aspergillus sclerotioniger CBS 115572]PWY93762.1 MFS general substrate transporter [Aspergillus sclerotioniger CBS 115572]
MASADPELDSTANKQESIPPQTSELVPSTPLLYVTWNGPNDPSNPQNWTYRQKWAGTLIISGFGLVSPISSSMVSPAVDAIAHEFGTSSTITSEMILSIFVLAWGLGPLLLGPLSEMYGRVRVLQLGNLMYLIFNIAGGFSQSTAQIIVFRFLSGFGGSGPLVLGDGVLADIWPTEQRGSAVAIYSLAPLFGPAIGPIAGDSSRISGMVGLLGIFFLKETYTPYLLKLKAQNLRKETGNQSSTQLWKTSIARPFLLLGTQPIIQALGIYMAFLYGLMYLMLASFPSLWQDIYRESISIASLNYISIGVGLLLGTQIGARLNNRIYNHLNHHTSTPTPEPLPEYRIPLLLPASILVGTGMFWYGWSANPHIPWIIPNLGIALISIGIIIAFQCIQLYIIDTYPLYAASAMSATAILRSLAGFAFPLFANDMYARLGYGWGNTVLGFVAILVGGPAMILLWRGGAGLRRRSPYASGWSQ